MVLEVVHLVFTTGHTAPVGERLLRDDLLDRALELGLLMHAMLPQDSDAAALLALMLLTDARRATRTSSAGELVLLSEQDRTHWDRQKIDHGRKLLMETLVNHPPGVFALQAAIAAVHADAPTWSDTDWAEIVALYDALATLRPSPVVQLNRAIAVGMCHGPRSGLAALTPLLSEPSLASYSYLSAARADFLRQLSRWDQAVTAYEEALALTDNEVERTFLTSRLHDVGARLKQRT